MTEYSFLFIFSLYLFAFITIGDLSFLFQDKNTSPSHTQAMPYP